MSTPEVSRVPPFGAAPEPAPAVTPPPAARKPREPAPAKVASRSEPAPPAADRTPAGGSSSGAAPKLFSARTSPATALPTAGARVIALVPVGAATGARGQLLWEPIGGGTLVVSGLPQLPIGRTYQLWLGSIDLGTRVSAGLLAVDAQGAGTLRVAPPRATWAPDIFGVTMERQGGGREPSDDLVLVGELARQTVAAAPPPATPSADLPSPQGLTAPASGAEAPPSTASPMVAAVPPPTSSRLADGQLVRVFPVPVDRTWSATQSALRSLGWNIDRVDQTTGVIRTGPRYVTFKNFVLYSDGTRHALDVVVRAVSANETAISVRREVVQERRVLWATERKVVETPESPLEQTVLDAIERLL
jgi:hypothetical protein